VNPVITRPATSTDAPAIADFFNDIARAAGGDPWFMIDPVAGWFTSGLIRDPLIDSRVMIADGIVVAAGMIAPPSEDEGKVDAWGGVRPEWRGRGLGRSLLGWQWDRAVALCPPAPRGSSTPTATWPRPTRSGCSNASVSRSSGTGSRWACR
jgi:mycothiol synthase